jgi:hypothetical protein
VPWFSLATAAGNPALSEEILATLGAVSPVVARIRHALAHLMRISILGVAAVTVWPGSHWISRPLDQRKSLCAASTAFCERADWRGAAPCYSERLVQPLSFRERRIRSTSC